jgi:hypothetical protein
MQFYFAKPLANNLNLPQNFKPEAHWFWIAAILGFVLDLGVCRNAETRCA